MATTAMLKRTAAAVNVPKPVSENFIATALAPKRTHRKMAITDACSDRGLWVDSFGATILYR
jgi:hypothetical protein